MLPNALPTMIITAATDIGTIMLSLASLSFLGFGIQPPTPEWGYMLSEGRTYILSSPWLLFCPGLAVFITVVIFNLWVTVLEICRSKCNRKTKKEEEKENMNGKKLIALALACALRAVSQHAAAAQEQSRKQRQTEETRKHQLNVATELTSATLDPADEWNSWFVMRWGALETLTRFEDDGTVSPWLAEDWSVADDQLTWTIKLKENVTFSNGEPMTATKVQESLERLFDVTDPNKGGNGNPWNYFTYDSISCRR